ncbi:MAG: hypothetical protein JZU53_01575 [Paludibacter sp.]|nr:hypothetical protein [Paludibacter sp.]
MKRIIFLTISAVLIFSSVSTIKAQDDISNIFKAGVVDLNQVANGYLKPAGNCLAAGLATNWYNTAAVHKLFGFDLTIGVGAIGAPQTERMFDLTGLTNLKPTISGTTQAPTLVGTGNGVELNLMQPHFMADGTTVNPLWNNGTGKITSFVTPAGLSQYVPTASVQFTIGLPFINDVSIRYSPTVQSSVFEASMLGIGVKHNLKQWLPIVKNLPIDVAVLLAYNKLNMKYTLPTADRITPDKLVSGGLGYIPDATSSEYSTQGASMVAKAMIANLIISKKLAFFTPYLGFGVTKTNFDLTLNGNYPTLDGLVIPAGTTTPMMKVKNITNPFQVSSSEVMPNATIGLRLKILWMFSLHAEYTIQKYPIASAGFGVLIR